LANDWLHETVTLYGEFPNGSRIPLMCPISTDPIEARQVFCAFNKARKILFYLIKKHKISHVRGERPSNKQEKLDKLSLN
jgi:hypothetical protein